jgi:hypothetical protein
MSWHLRLCDGHGREEWGKGEVSTSGDGEGKSLQSMFFEALEEEECSSSIASDETSWGENAWITDWKELLTASMSYRIMTEDSSTRTRKKGHEYCI